VKIIVLGNKYVAAVIYMAPHSLDIAFRSSPFPVNWSVARIESEAPTILRPFKRDIWKQDIVDLPLIRYHLIIRKNRVVPIGDVQIGHWIEKLTPLAAYLCQELLKLSEIRVQSTALLVLRGGNSGNAQNDLAEMYLNEGLDIVIFTVRTLQAYEAIIVQRDLHIIFVPIPTEEFVTSV
jgi:hypothetical protein